METSSYCRFDFLYITVWVVLLSAAFDSKQKIALRQQNTPTQSRWNKLGQDSSLTANNNHGTGYLTKTLSCLARQDLHEPCCPCQGLHEQGSYRPFTSEMDPFLASTYGSVSTYLQSQCQMPNAIVVDLIVMSALTIPIVFRFTKVPQHLPAAVLEAHNPLLQA